MSAARWLPALLAAVALLVVLLRALPGCPSDASAPLALLPPPPPPPDLQPLQLALGVITAPGHFNRRVWMRQKLRVSEARERGVRVLFVLGSRNHMSKRQRKAVRHEERAHRDVIFVPARDYLPHAVAEKSLGWWLYAASNLRARWIGKTDDDSLTYLPRLEHELQLMVQMGRSHYYYGVMTWRAWTPLHTEPE